MIVTTRCAGCDGRCGVRQFCCRTRTPQRTAKSCGPGAATVASIRAGPCWRGNGDKKRRSPGRARSKPSNHCAGKAGMSRLYLSNPCAFSSHCTRCCGRSQRPAFPAPSFRSLFGEGQRNCKPRAKNRAARTLPAVVARLERATQYSRDVSD